MLHMLSMQIPTASLCTSCACIPQAKTRTRNARKQHRNAFYAYDTELETRNIGLHYCPGGQSKVDNIATVSAASNSNNGKSCGRKDGFALIKSWYLQATSNPNLNGYAWLAFKSRPPLTDTDPSSRRRFTTSSFSGNNLATVLSIFVDNLGSQSQHYSMCLCVHNVLASFRVDKLWRRQ